MNKNESFVARWSRRKQLATAEHEMSDAPAASSPAASKDGGKSEQTSLTRESAADQCGLPDVAANAVDKVFDPHSVPPIESIGAHTDIRGFLARNVPLELSRAALR